VRKRVDQAYTDKLDGKISEDFWQRKAAEWQMEEEQILMAIQGLENSRPDTLLTVKRTLELANTAYFQYLTQNPAEQGRLLKKVLLNCRVDGASLYPTYRKPFDLIFERAKNREWSGREDLNLRPPAPKAGALPGCATPRQEKLFRFYISRELTRVNANQISLPKLPKSP
jgi:site-specific DNA recombinase